MFPILKKQKLAENSYMIEIEASDIARKAKPGQFIILRIDEHGERIPLSIADISKKSITIIFLVAGKTTEQLSKLKKGDFILNFVGPLGNPTELKKLGHVCLVGGGIGVASLYIIAKAFREQGNKITIIIGARTKDLLITEDKLKEVSDKLLIATDDGSKGKKGFVTDVLKGVIDKSKIDLVFAVGPVIMMSAVSKLTYKRIRTVVSLNPIMVDGTGMCGSCRVSIDGETKFACVDGPEFNADLVNWDELINRNSVYEEEEHKCKLEGAK